MKCFKSKVTEMKYNSIASCKSGKNPKSGKNFSWSQILDGFAKKTRFWPQIHHSHTSEGRNFAHFMPISNATVSPSLRNLLLDWWIKLIHECHANDISDSVLDFVFMYHRKFYQPAWKMHYYYVCISAKVIFTHF